MYESLREWCRFPVNVHKCTGPTAAGDLGYALLPVVEKGYRVDEMKQIIDKEGKAYLSFAQVYFPPEVSITALDRISFPSDINPCEIRKLGGFYDGNTGMLDIRVVYL